MCSVPVSFPGRLHSTLELLEVDESDGQAGKVANVVVEQLGSIKHAIIKAPVTNLEIKVKHIKLSVTLKRCSSALIILFVTVEKEVNKKYKNSAVKITPLHEKDAAVDNNCV